MPRALVTHLRSCPPQDEATRTRTGCVGSPQGGQPSPAPEAGRPPRPRRQPGDGILCLACRRHTVPAPGMTCDPCRQGIAQFFADGDRAA